MRGIEPAQQILQVSVPLLGAPVERRVPPQPGVRNKFNYAVNNIWCDPPSHRHVYLVESAGKLEEHVVFYHRKRGSAALTVVSPGVVEVEGRTMIDEPEVSVPYKHIRVAW